jgi:hypothetical protein
MATFLHGKLVKYQTLLPGYILLILIQVLACNSNIQSDTHANDRESGEKEIAGKSGLNACSILEKSIYAEILGSPVDDGNEILSSGNSSQGTSVSQCSFHTTTGSPAYVSVMIRRDAKKNTNPTSLKTYQEIMIKDDSFGMGEDLKKAIEKGQTIDDIGDIAFTYIMEGLGSTLMVFWKTNYMMTVTINGLTDENKTLDGQKKIARAILEKL